MYLSYVDLQPVSLCTNKYAGICNVLCGTFVFNLITNYNLMLEARSSCPLIYVKYMDNRLIYKILSLGGSGISLETINTYSILSTYFCKS